MNNLHDYIMYKKLIFHSEQCFKLNYHVSHKQCAEQYLTCKICMSAEQFHVLKWHFYLHWCNNMNNQQGLFITKIMCSNLLLHMFGLVSRSYSRMHSNQVLLHYSLKMVLFWRFIFNILDTLKFTIQYVTNVM